MVIDVNPKHTAKCAAVLPPQAQNQFPVLAQVMQKANILWALLGSPLIYAFKCKHYVIGVDAPSRTVHLFRRSTGFFGPGKMTGAEQFPASALRDPQLKDGMLTATIIFTKPDGTTIKLFAPKPSKENAKEVYQMIQQARA